MRMRSPLGPVALALLAACAGAPPPPKAPPTIDTTPVPAPITLPLGARWIESGGATLVGPPVTGGTLVLLGGRRAILRSDGGLDEERAPAPEPLVEIIEVPSAKGSRLVGRGAHGVFRFDDPLGPPVVLAHSDEALARLGGGPGGIAVWRGLTELPRLLDVETGAAAPSSRLPAPPASALAFLDEKRGAAALEGVGLAVTTDGGATWRLVGAEQARSEALRVHGLRVRHGEIRAFTYDDGPDGLVDVEGARVHAFEPEHVASEAPLLRWIRATRRDPLEALATAGVELPDGRALTASHGVVARVEPKTGAIDGLVDLAHGKATGPCGVGRTGQAAWIACSITDEGRDLFDPFGVVRVPIADAGAALTTATALGTPELVRNGEADLAVSPSGGAMLLAPCGADEAGAACVRQPDGTWRTIAIRGELAERGGGPLADGRVAFLRGMFDGDDAEPTPPPPGGPGPRPKSQASPPQGDEAGVKQLHVSVVGRDGAEHALAPIPFTMSRGYVRVQSAIEEDPDRTLRFVIEDGDGPFAVVVPPGKEGPQVHRIPDAAVARIHAGRGIAVGDGKVLASLDGGATWNDVPAPPRALEAARAAAASYEEPSVLVVSELGAKVGSMLRLGWGPADAASDATPSRADALGAITWGLATPAVPQVLTCTSQRGAGGTPLLSATLEVRSLLGGKPAPKPAGTRRESSLWSASHGGMLDGIALFEEEGPEARDAAPAKWTLHWHDPFEIGARVRSAAIPVPKGASWTTSLRYAAVSGDRALVALRSGSKLRLMRIKPGSTEAVDVPSDVVPTGEAVFGSGHSEVIAWIRDAQVFVWLPGEHPRAIARVAGEASKTLGAPTTAGVPVLISGVDWSLQRVLPIPPLEKGAAAIPPPAQPTLEGWARLAALPQRLDALPPCAAKNADPRFLLRASSLGAEVDGIAEKAAHVMFDVRVRGPEACLAGLTATLAPERRRAAAPRPGAPAPPAFVRVDLMGNRAEGGDRGLAPATSRRLACTLGTKQPAR